MKNKYITERERYKIEAWLEENISKKVIACRLGKSLSTIYREIKQGTIELLDSEWNTYTCYKADVSQRKHLENVSNKGREYKISNDYDFVKYVEHMIVDLKYSPTALLLNIKNKNLNFATSVCVKTIYNYIENGVFLGVTNKHLPVKRKGSKKRNDSVTVALNNKVSRSIEERPSDIDLRSEFGHWELDTVVSGKGKTSCLYVFTERMTRLEYIFKASHKSADCTLKVLNRLERQLGSRIFRERFKTITCDNGVEFLNSDNIEKSCINKNLPRSIIYYCHPYSSWERGSNENANKLIRRFIPKGSDISKFTDEYIEYVQNWINNYPRLILGGKSSNMILKDCLA